MFARPREVAQALACPALTVSAGQGGDDVPVSGALGLQAAAAARTTAALHDQDDVFDVMALASTVLPAALGAAGDQVGAVTDLTAQACDASVPHLGPPVDPQHGDAAADELADVLASVGPWDDEQVAAVAGLLFQARDATAALIGSTLLADHPGSGSGVESSLDATLCWNSPVQCTRRTAAEDVRIGTAEIPRGAPVWVVLAAAEQGPPARVATYGAGPHTGPGAAHAVALARGVLSGLGEGGW